MLQCGDAFACGREEVCHASGFLASHRQCEGRRLRALVSLGVTRPLARLGVHMVTPFDSRYFRTLQVGHGSAFSEFVGERHERFLESISHVERRPAFGGGRSCGKSPCRDGVEERQA